MSEHDGAWAIFFSSLTSSILDVGSRRAMLTWWEISREAAKNAKVGMVPLRRGDRNEKHSVSECREGVLARHHSGQVFVCDFLGSFEEKGKATEVTSTADFNMNAQSWGRFRYPVYLVHPCWNLLFLEEGVGNKKPQ